MGKKAPDQVNQQVNKFKELLANVRTDLLRLRQAWAPEQGNALASYCKQNSEAIAQYDKIYTILLERTKTKKEIQQMFMGPECEALRKHLGDGPSEEENDESNFEKMNMLENENKRLHGELEQKKDELEKIVKKAKMVEDEAKNSSAELELLKNQMVFIQSDLSDIRNKQDQEKVRNTELYTAMSMMSKAYAQQEKELVAQKELLEQERKSGKMLVEYFQRKIALTSEEYTDFTNKNDSFKHFIATKNMDKVIDLWVRNTVLLKFYSGNIFSQPQREYFTVHKTTLINLVNDLLIIMDNASVEDEKKSFGFIILSQIIYNNNDLLNYFFRTLSMQGRESAEEAVFKTYKLEDNMKLVIHLFSALKSNRHNTYAKKIVEHASASSALAGHLKTIMGRSEFDGFRDYIIEIYPVLKPVSQPSHPLVESLTVAKEAQQPPKPPAVNASYLNLWQQPGPNADDAEKFYLSVMGLNSLRN